jgi:hypothetical protein
MFEPMYVSITEGRINGAAFIVSRKSRFFLKPKLSMKLRAGVKKVLIFDYLEFLLGVFT